ncbi:hypothetical protein FGO68_gene12296 [Halteria grandinella]|uniref:Uncharacterized protein n=1 Tax=Halteria grandinella TaxID=5974 RepID=A0A8J8T0Q7_HALGN|nr:hypothetical protein FGO68_gene12296 [Halteria grandinella]
MMLHSNVSPKHITRQKPTPPPELSSSIPTQKRLPRPKDLILPPHSSVDNLDKIPSQIHQWRQESDVEDLKRRITDLEQALQTNYLDTESKQRRILELEQWIQCLSESTLVAAGGNQREASLMKKQINVCIERLDRLFAENFGLKKDLAYEKKRYMDLMSAFLELRNSLKAPQSPAKSVLSYTETHREDILTREKALEQTLMSLTEEVETLSQRNEEFLRDLRARHDFYGAYQESQDELRKLREAHALLISMIQSQQLQVTPPPAILSLTPQQKVNSFGFFGKLADMSRENQRSHAESEYIQSKPSTSFYTGNGNRGRQSESVILDNSEILIAQNSSRRNRSSASEILKSFITCGSLAGGGNHYGMAQPPGEDADVQRAVMNNEYIRMIIRDPSFTQRVNFLKR